MLIRNLKRMLTAELAAADALAELSPSELATYAKANPSSPFVSTAGLKPRVVKTGIVKPPPKPKPVGSTSKPVNPVKPAGAPTTKSQFNQSIHKHFAGNVSAARRQLTDEHKKAISEGLKRWHAAHGRGQYTNRERKHAIKHLTNRFTNLAAHHLAMHAVHKQRASAARKSGNMDMHAVHKQRAQNSLKKHKTYNHLLGGF